MAHASPGIACIISLLSGSLFDATERGVLSCSCFGCADSWPQSLAIQASPAHVSAMVKQRAELVDNIWHACGDTAMDYNWYTKRGLLAGVYAATELFMITDYSPGYEDTWKSLDRRLEDLKRFGSAAAEVRALAVHEASNVCVCDGGPFARHHRLLWAA